MNDPTTSLDTTREPLVGVLENIRSMGNVGSMFRSADGAGVGRLLLCGFTPHPPRKEIEKTALGATDFVPWEYFSRASQACDWLNAAGYRIVALESTPTSAPIELASCSQPTAFVVGNEVTGVSAEVLERCDQTLHIPMAGQKESLNVAVAFAVAAFQLAAQLRSEVHTPPT